MVTTHAGQAFSNSVELSPTGSFNCAALASGRRFDAAELLSDEPLLGLQREAGYMWGTLRDEDGELYSVMRRIAPPGAAQGTGQSLAGKLLVVSSGTPEGQLQLRREPRGAADSTEIERRPHNDNAVRLAPRADASGRSMQLVLSQDEFSYVEEGVIDVAGRMVVPPLQWYLPGPQSSLLYISHTWLVDGELLGKRARGFLFWEEAWMPPGGQLYVAKDPLHDAEYLTWYSWANLWSDGECEVGHFLFGKRDFHVGVIANSDGTVTSARTMDAVISRADDGYWHAGINYQIDGVDWVCEPDPQGRMQGLGKMPNPQQEGRMHRVDDTRLPDVWMAWGETVPAAGDRRR
ncbi:MAG: hypothetical protein QOI39_3755 [Mycobacterium sp.]|jgi:hypothetical protein|nr:hypothetical protein [Mycobacterium sp.]MDT5233255.1 hypothetical protein [Mycobacterium sp.]